jgi:hypothetical protein
MDQHNLQLPNEQSLLIRSAAAANPQMIVVFMSGGLPEMGSWVENIPNSST